jgi:hemoglobin
MRHLPFRIGEAERDRWLEIMTAAMEEAGVSLEVASALGAFFSQVADFLRNQEPFSP